MGKVNNRAGLTHEAVVTTLVASSAMIGRQPDDIAKIKGLLTIGGQIIKGPIIEQIDRPAQDIEAASICGDGGGDEFDIGIDACGIGCGDACRTADADSTRRRHKARIGARGDHVRRQHKRGCRARRAKERRGN